MKGTAQPMPAKEKILAGVRELMRRHSVDAYLVPQADPHNSEYAPAAFARVRALSGFTGSAGTAIVTQTEAHLWTDARYWLQAPQEMSPAWELKKASPTNTIHQWAEQLPENSTIGVDPLVLSMQGHQKLQDAVKSNKAKVVPIRENLVDVHWADRPPLPTSEVYHLEDEFTGRPLAEKIAAVKEHLDKKKSSALIVSALDEVAWLLNLRGSDIPNTPVFLAYALVTNEGKVTLFTQLSRVSRRVLDSEEYKAVVTFREYGEFFDAFEQTLAGSRALVDSAVTSWGVAQTLEAIKCEALHDSSCVASAKVKKNAVEQQGFINCHVRDGVALCTYLKWLEDTVASGEKLMEIQAISQLLKFRAQQKHFKGVSFETISGCGPTAAVIHNRPCLGTNDHVIGTDHIYLVDSGGQYKDGTTDVTRTVHFGTPNAREIEAYTLVLKGSIGIATAVWPDGASGSALDSLARRALWKHGLDFLHGTGHGVGHFLGVHEGPIGISSRPTAPLGEGSVVSNEPGFYLDGAFGIRIENLELVVKAATKYRFNDKQFLTMRTLTMAPLEPKLIDVSLLSEDEITWVNTYHRTVLDTISKNTEDAALKKWLAAKCKPLASDESAKKRQRTQ
ncbi:putative Xaa-Pro aminopeptidase P [Diplonema papillatum]|nr:putative Xaa-Pro aminopeptidase P [Diplonema papillatum]